MIIVLTDSTNGVVCPSEYVPGGTVLHEFGHALGMQHEHQNYLGGNVIEYDTDGATLFMLGNSGVYDENCVQDLCTKLCLDESIRPDFCNSDCDEDLVPSTVCKTQWDRRKGNVHKVTF